jgi:NAD(P)H dehydrogenase (quinone)
MTDTIFVTGASGQLGRLVIKHLLSRSVKADRIIAGTRNVEKLADLATLGVAVRRADFDDPEGLVAAFEGVGTALIISTDMLDGVGTRLKQHRNAVASAVAAGVKRLAYTSLPNPESSLLSFAPDHLETERAIKATGLPHCIFRNGWYHENLLRALPSALKSGTWHSAARGGKISYAAREDVAEAIAAALATPGTESQTFTFTGAEALSTEEVASMIEEATGKRLSVAHVSDEQFVSGIKAAGVPEVYIPVLISAEAEVRAGNLSLVTDHLASLIGHAPKRLSTHFLEAKAAYAD